MGTNYYLQKLDSETKRARDIHICKISSGWTPSMRGYRDGEYVRQGEGDWYQNDLRTWLDWKWYLLKETKKGGIIFDEYDEPISLKKFIKHIQTWQDGDCHDGTPKSNHAVEARKGSFSDGIMDSHAESCWVDSEGYSFHDGEFS